MQLAACELSICLDQASLLEAVASDQAPIIGGSEDTSNHATIALFLTTPEGDRAMCSATSIARHGDRGFALTAAHCVQGTVDYLAMEDDIAPCIPMGGDPACPHRYGAVEWFAHPAYDPASLTYDVAVVAFQITEGIDAPPIVPIAWPDDELDKGDLLELSGFGQIAPGAKGTVPFQTKRHHVEAPVATLMDRVIRFDASLGETSCFGDSGGPAYSTVGGVRRVVGVASSSDAECRFFGNYFRVSDVAEDFIQPILDAYQEPGGGGAGGEGGAGDVDVGASGGEDVGGAGGMGPSSSSSVGGAGAEPDAGGSGGGGAQTCAPLVLSCQASAVSPSHGFGAWIGFGLLLLRRRRTLVLSR